MTTFLTYWLLGWFITMVYEFTYSPDVKGFSFGNQVVIVVSCLILWPLPAAVAIMRLVVPDMIKYAEEQTKRDREQRDKDNEETE